MVVAVGLAGLARGARCLWGRSTIRGRWRRRCGGLRREPGWCPEGGGFRFLGYARNDSVGGSE